MDENESGTPLIGLAVLFVGAAFIVVGVAFLTFGLYTLIRTGIWPDYPFSRMLAEIGIPHPQLTWPSGQRAISWIFSQSTCVILLTIGSAIAALGAWLIARFHRRQRDQAEAAEAAA